ncbi:cysteine desulfurase [uncultured Thermanaerothrix sp.]|uniref:aminotransferase class V-fold PLP-dependent enzyme n=1 Tax=uncultured Thermanaerothrix sp. TaxID=1195149 RepID=UPI00261BE6BA|nr:cysteine desulfurase [uncultured Thermanaerothrix sp.]
MNITKIRADFPSLEVGNGRKPVIYFDNACQTLRPRQVIEAVQRYYQEFPACSGRSMHRMATEVTREVDQAREKVAKFLNAGRKEEIIFTRNTTEGVNLIASALNWKAGDVILVSDKEHNSNLIPWQMVAKRHSAILRVVHTRADNTFDMEAFEQALKAGPVKLVAMGYTSNLDGVTIPAAEIVKRAHQQGALVFLDAAQTIPHQRVNVRALDVDFLAFSGHKMMGPSGTGVLYGKYRLLEQLEPFLVGGDTVSSSTYETCQFLPPPEKFEAGLQDYAGIIGLAAAVQYIQSIGFDTIEKQERLLNEFLSEGLEEIPGVRLIGPSDPRLRSGIVAFYIEGVDHHRIALMLDQMANIAVRSGQHCVHSWFNARGVAGSVRASVYVYNTLEEAKLFLDSLIKIRKVL